MNASNGSEGPTAESESEKENEEVNARGWRLSNCNHDTNEERTYCHKQCLTNEYLRAGYRNVMKFSCIERNK